MSTRQRREIDDMCNTMSMLQVNAYDMAAALDMLAQLESEQTGQRMQHLQVMLSLIMSGRTRLCSDEGTVTAVFLTDTSLASLTTATLGACSAMPSLR